MTNLCNHLPNLLLSLVIFCAALALYIVTAPPGMIYDGGISADSAELQRIAYRLGIAHSTGYPVWTVLGYAFAHLGEALGGSPYTWVTYLSGMTSAAALVVFFQAMRLIARPPAALAVTILLGVSDIFWHMSTIAEVQGLQALILALLLWLTLLYLRRPESFVTLAGIVCVAAFGLANHRTVVMAFPAIGIAVLLVGQWRHLSLRQWGILVIVGVIPLLSYLLLYWRGTDPFVAYSTRLPWIPTGLSAQDVTDLIRGTFQDGQALTENYTLDSAVDNLPLVVERIIDEITVFGVLASIVGIVILAWRRWRESLVLALWSIAFFGFLIAWKPTDVKVEIYQWTLLIGLLPGLAVLLSLTWLPRRVSPVLVSLLSLPAFALALSLYTANLPERDLSDDTRAEHYTESLARVDDPVLLYSASWSPEFFITLEYLDTTDTRTPLPVGTDLWWVPLDDIRNTSQTVYIGEAWRSRYGFYDGATWFLTENDIAVSGTDTDLFMQLRPVDDPRLQDEADSATVITEPITPEITLYSYDLNREDDALYITLFWQAQTAVETDYSVYTHLREYGTACDPDSLLRLVAQDDSFAPVLGAYPTRLWQAGQIVKDTYIIPLDGTPAPDLDWTLNVGMTNATNGERAGDFCLPLAF